MRYINYQSDFEFYQELGGREMAAAPFELEYYIPGKAEKLVASYDGAEYVNCRPDGKGIVVSVDYSEVQLGMGSLRCTAKYYLDNDNFKDGVYEPVSDFEVGITLHRGESDDMGDLVVTPLPAYTKGEKGEPLTYDGLSEEEKDDLASRVAAKVGDLSEYAKKSDIPTETSQLTNDSGYVTSLELATAIQQAITNTLNTEV